MPNTKLRVGIVGAGLGGLTAAIGIARAGHDVTILEQTGVLAEIGAGIQIPPNASHILKRYGLLDEVEAVSVRPTDLILRSYRDGAILSTYNVDASSKTLYGNPYLHIHRADYHKILVKEAERVGVYIQLGSAVVAIDFEKAIVRVNGKPDFHGDVILGADGLKSMCRECLLGHADPPLLTGDLAYRIVIKADDMRARPDLRALVTKPMLNYWMGPHSHVVCYLLQGGSLYNIVLICPDNLPDRLNTAQADIQEMRAHFYNWDPTLKALLSLVGETTKWRLLNSEEMECWSHPSGTFALLGDACHATLPYLAQGAALAIEDGAVLGTLFEKIENRSQIPDVLMIYEKLRKARTTRVVKGSTALRDIFHMVDGERQRERDRQLLEEAPFEGYPNRWADPVFQRWLFGYDAFAEADEAWKEYIDGKKAGEGVCHAAAAEVAV